MNGKGAQMQLTGAPKLVVWAEKIRKDRLKVWQETSPEIFKAVEAIVTQEKSADWWIAHKDKGLEVIIKQLRSGNLPRQRTKQPRQQQEKKKE
ncbi:hypothetical protein KI809_07435 [Geobacter pelophilus]|uniref:Uncharacterized protein n=1 Tax=Geoanaerobacter pelophilus TaxID=60036 RepID=A0AAW4L778_9BACT|nr:hypothetical protein [Geoanaerobacter pelophilus]MBT0664131.1 hypothetical protein [Geoanaerobacter pelophilus]